MEPEGSLPFTSGRHLSVFWASSIHFHTPTSHSPKIQLHLTPSTPGCSKWSPSVRFPHQNTVYASPLTHTCYIPRPSHSSQFIIRTILGEQHRSLSSSLCSVLHYPVTSSLLRPNILNTLFSNTLSLRDSLNVSDQVPHPYKKQAKL
jgi:hypothetical protein